MSWRDYDEDDRYQARDRESWRDRERFDERTTIPGYRSRSQRGYGREHHFGENEHDWRGRMESSDLSDRTYGTHLGQGLSGGRSDFWPFEPRSQGSQYRDNEGAYGQAQFGHRDYGRGRPGMYGQRYAQQPGSYGQQPSSYAQQPSSYGYQSSAYGQYGYGQSYDVGNAGDEYGYGFEQEGPIERMGHRIGHFVKNVFKKPFRAPKGYTRSDERIREDVCDALAHLGEADPSDVEVTVSGGEVTLTGTVPHRYWKHQIEDAAEQVSGVKDVTNNIRVKAREFDATRTIEDRSLAESFSTQTPSRRNGGNRTAAS